jgi:uncharacterized protein (DUF2062 family)
MVILIEPEHFMHDTHMKTTKEDLTSKKRESWLQKYSIRKLIERAKTLHGDPHYIAMGMAIGVFVSITPIVPFHTVIAIALAFILKGSKPAAAIGVWFCNPVTVPFFYFGSYKAGMFIIGRSIPFDQKYESISELMKLGTDVTIAMVTGGVILGILPGIAAYFITRRTFKLIRSRKRVER